MERLVREGADVDGRATNGSTPLHQAAWKGHRNLAEALLAHGASVHAKDLALWTPLHWAASRGQRTVISLLIARGADVNATTNRGETALALAQRLGHQDSVLLLEAEGYRRGTTTADWKQADQDCQRQTSQLQIFGMPGFVPLGPQIELGKDAQRRQAEYDSCTRGHGFPAVR